MNDDDNISTEELRATLLSTTTTRKHSAYQTLSSRLAHLIGVRNIQIHSKYEYERLQYILTNIGTIDDKSILDIGSNVGYFGFELLDAGARTVTAYEGELAHYNFLTAAANALHERQRISIHHEYFNSNSDIPKHDIALLLNVVHHLGEDYGPACENIEEAKALMIRQLIDLSKHTNLLIFQMGFNWKGNIHQCLFPHGTKAEMIDFVTTGTKNFWKIQHIGIAEKNAGVIRYVDINDANIARDDSLGEFLNRPLFIMRTR